MYSATPSTAAPGTKTDLITPKLMPSTPPTFIPPRPQQSIPPSPSLPGLPAPPPPQARQPVPPPDIPLPVLSPTKSIPTTSTTISNSEPSVVPLGLDQLMQNSEELTKQPEATQKKLSVYAIEATLKTLPPPPSSAQPIPKNQTPPNHPESTTQATIEPTLGVYMEEDAVEHRKPKKRRLAVAPNDCRVYFS